MFYKKLIIARLDYWKKNYGDNVPIEEVRRFLVPTRLEFVRRTYWYDPMSDMIFNINTGKHQDSTHMSCGGDYSPITIRRGEWFLRMGTDPWRVMMDETGLCSKASADAPKIYAT